MTEILRQTGEQKGREPANFTLGKFRSAWYTWRISNLVRDLEPGTYGARDNVYGAHVSRDSSGMRVEVWKEDEAGYDGWEEHVTISVFAEDSLGVRVNASIDDYNPQRGIRTLNCGEADGTATDKRVPHEIVRALHHIPATPTQF